jgi:hypothetical protein
MLLVFYVTSRESAMPLIKLFLTENVSGVSRFPGIFRFFAGITLLSIPCQEEHPPKAEDFPAGEA